MRHFFLHVSGLVLALLAAAGARAELAAVTSGPGGKLVYHVDEQGNRIPDFSHCGYAGANRPIDDVAAAQHVAPAAGDDTDRIQAAINAVAALPADAAGFRGAVVLAAGEFQIAGQLRIETSGIVLRGGGAGEGGTTVVATGADRRAVIVVSGRDDRKLVGEPQSIVDDYVPVGTQRVRLAAANALSVGAAVVVTRPSTKEWIQAVGGDAFGVGWRPGSRDLRWDRIVTAIEGDVITLDAPITTAIERQFGGGTVTQYTWLGRIAHVGIEDLRLISQPATSDPLDEDHAWFGVVCERVENAWIRRVEFQHFAGGAVALWETTKWITVEDCLSLAPVAEQGGFRRRAFSNQGQLSLFLRCWSEQGRHDFAVGHCAPGPNAFVNCRTHESTADSGPLESWGAGVLYDNVRIDGNALNLKNRWATPPGAGWSAANCVLWQCRAATIACFRPPTANNWAIGCWGIFSGDGTFAARSDFVQPLSLYQAQLRDRLGEDAAKRVGPILGGPVTATNPRLDEAARFAAESLHPARELVDEIRDQFRRSLTTPALAATESDQAHDESQAPAVKQQLSLQNGWLTAAGRLVTGGRLDPLWWRGSVRPDDVAELGPAITRFVPGRIGPGFTNDLAAVADLMQTNHLAAYDHHYGLWYERRRDDHTMGRQQDGDVAAPFYEQPFRRVGKLAAGTAWDGLSKYDLTQFNPWYWDRLRTFAKLCDERGLVLFHQNYFQHNILEAGAHWVDSPWRPANNVNETGLPEPPPYIGDKRQFIAPTFYDSGNKALRALHRGYIRQGLNNFADVSNVIQMTSGEYSGPLEFVEFWLDTIGEWQRDTSRDALVALSAPKNVQDAILADPKRAQLVDVIDIRYWSYTADGSLYAPDGGQNLAPRQHLRQTRQKPGGAAAIVTAVREYRGRFPEKAIIYNAEENCPSGRDGWAVLIAGGSLPAVTLPAELAGQIPNMRPADTVTRGENQWALADQRGNYLYYSANLKSPLLLTLPAESNRYRARWLDSATGAAVSDQTLELAGDVELPFKTGILWLSRQD